MNRRQFLKNISLLTGAGTVAFKIGTIPVKAIARPFLNIKNTNDKILVVVQLKGGNDGLNSVIQFENDIYYNNRPTLAVAKEDVIQLSDILGFHPSLAPFKNLYDEGLLNIVQNVGYANQNRSHFRSTDIWLSASDSEQYLFDGWAGRYLSEAFPDYPTVIPEHPMALQLGSVQSLMLLSEFGGMGVTIEEPNQFYQLVQGSQADTDPPPETIAGDELKFLKQIAAQSIQYAGIIKEKADAAQNLATYPDTKLATQLAIIADLIGGGLETPVYLATQKGFDNHASQVETHAALLTELSEAITAFQSDLQLMGIEDKVVLMTISEFGRRLEENGSLGTDHGAAAPLFMVGKPVEGGIFGNIPDLSDLDNRGDIKFKYDYRQIYATVLKDHLGMTEEQVNTILLKQFETLPLINTNPTSVEKNRGIPKKFSLSQNYPNPFNSSTQINNSIAEPTKVNLTIFDSLGRRIRTLINEFHNAGNYSVDFHASDFPSGNYIFKISAGGFTKQRKMVLIK